MRTSTLGSLHVVGVGRERVLNRRARLFGDRMICGDEISTERSRIRSQNFRFRDTNRTRSAGLQVGVGVGVGGGSG